MSAFDITKFDPQPSQELICSICYCVLSDALESRCRHVFCKQCIETWLQHHHSCPTCRDYLRRHHLKPVLPLVQNMLNALTMVCDFRDKGCKAPITMEQYENHIKNCEYQTVKCPNGCEQLLLLKDKQDHEQNACELRIVKCQLGCELSLPFCQNLAHSCITALKEHIRDKEKQLEGVVAFLQRMVQAVHDLSKALDIESSRSQLLHRFHDITSQLEQEQHMINQLFHHHDLKKHFMCSVSSAGHASEVTSDVSTNALTISSSSLSSCTAANASNNSSLPHINLDEEIAYSLEQPRTSLLESLVQEAMGSEARDRRRSMDQVDGYRDGDQNEDRIQNRWSINHSRSRRHVNNTNRTNEEMADPRHQETLEQETVDRGAAENSISSEDEEYLPNYRTSVHHLLPEVAESHGSYTSDSSGGLSGSFDSSDDSEYTPINSSLETDDDISDSFTVTSYSFDSPLSEITDDSNSGSHGEDHSRGSEHLASENESSVAETSRQPQGAAVSESHIYSYGSPHLEEEVVVRDGEYLHQDDIDQDNGNHGISSSEQTVSHLHPQEAGVCLSACAMLRLRNVLYKPDHGNSIASSSLFHDGQGHTVEKQEGPCYSRELCNGQSNVDLSLDSQMQIEIKEHQTGSKTNLSHLQDTSNTRDTYQIKVVINSDSTSLCTEDEHDDNKEMPNSFAQTSDHSSQHGSDTLEQPACSSLYSGDCSQISGQFENNGAYAGVQDAGTGNDVDAAETAAVTEELSTNVPDERGSTWHRSRFRDIYTSSDTESDDSRCRRMPRNILMSVASGNTEKGHSLVPKCQQSLLRKNNLTVITQEAGSSTNASQERPCSKRKGACILQEPESKHPRVERKMCSDGGSTERNGVSLVTDARAVHRKHSRLSSSTRCTSTACVVAGSTLLSLNQSVSAASASLPNPPPWARPNHMTSMAAATSSLTSSNLTPVHGSVASRTRSNCRGLSVQASVTQQPRHSRQTMVTSGGSATANGHGLVHIPDIPVPPNTYQLLTAYAEDDETDSTWTPTGSSQSESD